MATRHGIQTRIPGRSSSPATSLASLEQGLEHVVRRFEELNKLRENNVCVDVSMAVFMQPKAHANTYRPRSVIENKLPHIWIKISKPVGKNWDTYCMASQAQRLRVETAKRCEESVKAKLEEILLTRPEEFNSYGMDRVEVFVAR